MGMKVNDLIDLVTSANFLIKGTNLGKFFDNVFVVGGENYLRLTYNKFLIEISIQLEFEDDTAIISYTGKNKEYKSLPMGIKIPDLIKLLNLEKIEDMESEILKYVRPGKWSDYGVPTPED